MDWTPYLEILKEALVITAVVSLMMVLIEAAKIRTDGRVFTWLRRTRVGQIVISALLGAIPGCIGGYVSVSMYSRGLFSFGALLAMMVATTGDEAFVMLAQYPKTALLLTGGLLLFGILVGLVADALHGGRDAGEQYVERFEGRPDLAEEEHGAQENFWHRALHVLKHHLPKIFLWTFGTMLVLTVAGQFVDIESWVGRNTAWMVLIAALIGLIPQSGPHMVFVTLFAAGAIPLPVLLASCISQEGHAGLPLLAESRKSFLAAKTIKFFLALAVSYLLLLL